jgi:chromosome segregation ATPase
LQARRDAEKLVEEVMRRADMEAERVKQRETERGGEALELRERVCELEAKLKEATVEKASLKERIAALDADRTSLRVAVDEQVSAHCIVL